MSLCFSYKHKKYLTLYFMLKCHSGWIYNLDLVTSYRLYMNVYSVVNNYRCWLLYMNPENRKEMMRLGDVSQLSFHPLCLQNNRNFHVCRRSSCLLVIRLLQFLYFYMILFKFINLFVYFTQFHSEFLHISVFENVFINFNVFKHVSEERFCHFSSVNKLGRG